MRPPRIYPVLALLLGLTHAATSFCYAETLSAHVIKVSDGDTVKVRTSDNRIEKVRLNGIDCPESHQAFGNKAKHFTDVLVFDKDVNLECHGRDRYGRIIADVNLPNGTNVNRELVKNGYAWWFKRYSKDVSIEQLERQARDQRIGLWSEANPTPPWEFRRQQRPSAMSATVHR